MSEERPWQAGLKLTWIAVLVLAGPAAADEGTIDQAVLRELLARLAEIRGVAAPEPPQARKLSRTEAAKHFRESSTKDQQRMAHAEAALAALGLWPSGLDLADEMLELSAHRTAAFYEPREDALFYVSEEFKTIERLRRLTGSETESLAHELVHYLQDVTYPRLFAPQAPWRDHLDLAYAVRAAIEGEAGRDAERALGIAPATREEMERGVRTFRTTRLPEPDAASPPLVLGIGRSFPYFFGYRMALTSPALLPDPAGSTEQVMHPDRGEEPFGVLDLRPAHSLLPEPCEVQQENTAGEFLVAVIFLDLMRDPAPPSGEDREACEGFGSRDLLGLEECRADEGASQPVYAEAWEGWDGDRFLAARCGGSPELLWVTLWDDPEDALAFEEAYRAVAPRVAERAGYRQGLDVRRDGKEVLVVTPGLAPVAGSVVASARRGRAARMSHVVTYYRGDRDEAQLQRESPSPPDLRPPAAPR